MARLRNRLAHIKGRPQVACAVLLATVLALSTAIPGSAAAEDWNAVIAAARKEGKVTIYNGTGYPVVGAIARKFGAKYGITAQVLDGRASEIQERIRTEQAAGRWLGDVTFSGTTTLTPEKGEGRLQPHGALPDGGHFVAPLADDGTIVPAAVGNFAILVNPTMVKPGEIKSWKDLTDPKWKGRLLADDPRAAGAGEVWFDATYHAFGRGYEEQMAAQKPEFSRIYAQSERRVAQGEYPIYFPFNINELPALKGLPVQPIIPVEGVPYVPFAGAMLKNAPHPNAARLFVDFLVTEQAQVMFAQDALRPAVDGMADKVPAELRPFTTGAKLLGTTDPARRNEMLKLAQQIFK